MQLGTAFPVRLEAPHVVNMKKQVLATMVPWGPNGIPLQATFKYSNDPAFQVHLEISEPLYPPNLPLQLSKQNLKIFQITSVETASTA